MATNFLYLIEAENRRVKIGTSEVPARRLASARTLSPCMIRLIAQWRGTQTEEFMLHDRFREFRTHLEWFSIEGACAEFVEQKRGLGIVEIEDWHRLSFSGASERTHQKLERMSAAHKSNWSSPEFKRSMKILMRVGKRWSALCADRTARDLRPYSFAEAAQIRSDLEAAVTMEVDAAIPRGCATAHSDLPQVISPAGA